jgi:hypothetical protein
MGSGVDIDEYSDGMGCLMIDRDMSDMSTMYSFPILG